MKSAKKRPYTKAARAESEAETRSRIIDAVVSLHEEVGPAKTTVKAIAGRAGVQRLTVYRHFPEERDMIVACSARWNALHQPPDPSTVTLRDTRRRTRRLLLGLYEYYRENERMLANVFADSVEMPAVRTALEPFSAYLDALVGELEHAWPRFSPRRRATLQHAVQFTTWRSLATIMPRDADAIDLVLRWCDASGRAG